MSIKFTSEAGEPLILRLSIRRGLTTPLTRWRQMLRTTLRRSLARKRWSF